MAKQGYGNKDGSKKGMKNDGKGRNATPICRNKKK